MVAPRKFLEFPEKTLVLEAVAWIARARGFGIVGVGGCFHRSGGGLLVAVELEDVVDGADEPPFAFGGVEPPQ